MAEGIDFTALRRAIGALLLAVDGVVKVDRRGGTPTWRKPSYERPKQAYIEVDWTAVSEAAYAAGGHVDQTTSTLIEVWMPHSHTNPETATPWEALVKGLLDGLRGDPTLGGLTDPAYPPALPQVVVNDYQPKADGQSEPLCHHCRITMQYLHDFEV